MKKIAVIVGSLRKESWNRKLALSLIKLAPSESHPINRTQDLRGFPVFKNIL